MRPLAIARERNRGQRPRHAHASHRPPHARVPNATASATCGARTSEDAPSAWPPQTPPYNGITCNTGTWPQPLVPPPPLCDIPSGCCFFTGPWTVTRSSLRMLRRVAAYHVRHMRLFFVFFFEGGAWASRTQKHSEAGYGRPVDRGAWTAKTVKRPRQQPAQPSIRQLLGAAGAQTAHPATSSTAPAHQPLGSVKAETTPAGAPAAAADRTQRPDATCGGETVQGPVKKQ